MVPGRRVKNLRGEMHTVKRVDKINDKEAVFLTGTLTGYSVWKDSGRCVIPSMDDLGFLIPFSSTILEQEISNEGNQSQ